MTTRKLTPAEAVYFLRGFTDQAVDDGKRPEVEQAFAVIEKELNDYLEFSSEMHHRLLRMAPEAKGNTGELLDFVEKKLVGLQNRINAAAIDAWAKHSGSGSVLPVAPVPSDEEVWLAIENVVAPGNKRATTASIRVALKTLARRIGVQGVPQ